MPRWADVSAAQREALLAAAPTDHAAIDRAVFDVYGLSPTEIQAAQAAAESARVTRRT
ncbi:MAG: hypothetical protein KC420_06465 [Myxococcales bacterium]|nr:hypothetical protein [Myxococcales bacterium]